MTRSRSNLAWATALVTAGILGGCAFSDGDPWGQAEITLSVSHDGQSRRTDEGLLKTSKDYGLDLDALTLTLTSVTVSLSAEASAPFDPSAPPPGYTLCHNGHCHAESGDLVSYEDIANALATGGADRGPVLVQAVARPVELTGLDDALEVELGACAAGCALEPGFLQTVSVEIGAIEIHGRVFDLEGARLPEGGVAVSSVVPLGVRLTRTIDGEVGRGEPVRVGLGLEVELTEKLFDGVDWGAYPPDEGTIDVSQDDITSAIASKIEEGSTLGVEVTR